MFCHKKRLCVPVSSTDDILRLEVVGADGGGAREGVVGLPLAELTPAQEELHALVVVGGEDGVGKGEEGVAPGAVGARRAAGHQANAAGPGTGVQDFVTNFRFSHGILRLQCKDLS